MPVVYGKRTRTGGEQRKSLALQMKKMYEDEGHTIRYIAGHFEFSYGKVYQMMDEVGTRFRSPSRQA